MRETTTPLRASAGVRRIEIPLHQAPRIAVTRQHFVRRPRQNRHHFVERTLRYAVTLAITCDLDTGPYTVFYGYSVRRDGVSYGLEHGLSLGRHSVVESCA